MKASLNLFFFIVMKQYCFKWFENCPKVQVIDQQFKNNFPRLDIKMYGGFKELCQLYKTGPKWLKKSWTETSPITPILARCDTYTFGLRSQKYFFVLTLQPKIVMK